MVSGSFIFCVLIAYSTVFFNSDGNFGAVFFHRAGLMANEIVQIHYRAGLGTRHNTLKVPV